MRVLQKSSWVCSDALRLWFFSWVLHYESVSSSLLLSGFGYVGVSVARVVSAWKLIIFYLCKHELLVWKPGWNG